LCPLPRTVFSDRHSSFQTRDYQHKVSLTFSIYLFPCGTNRSFQSFPILQGFTDPTERSLGILTGFELWNSVGLEKVTREAESRVSSDFVHYHRTLIVDICQRQN